MFLNSNKQKILVVSDPHCEIDKLQKIIESEKADINVCLGDFFDSFWYNTEKDIEKTAKFFANFVLTPNCYTLYGNHDIMYLYDNRDLVCSGYEIWKYRLIDKILANYKNAILDKIKWYIWVDNYLLTHAGIHSSFLPRFIEPFDKENINNWLIKEGNAAFKNLYSGKKHWFYKAGMSRGGTAPFGGILWLDFDTEFEPIDDLKQILGHTSHLAIKPPDTEGSLNPNDWQNICIDCHLNQYLIIQNGKLEVKNYKDL